MWDEDGFNDALALMPLSKRFEFFNKQEILTSWRTQRKPNDLLPDFALWPDKYIFLMWFALSRRDNLQANSQYVGHRNRYQLIVFLLGNGLNPLNAINYIR